jgi:hypothetical protein
VQGSTNINTLPSGPKDIDAILVADIFLIPSLEFAPLCVNSKALTALDVPLAFPVDRLVKLLTSAAPNQDFGSKLAELPEFWFHLLSIEDMWPTRLILADCFPQP